MAQGPQASTHLLQCIAAHNTAHAHHSCALPSWLQTPVPVDDRWKHLGILGPVIHAEAGACSDTARLV